MFLQKWMSLEQSHIAEILMLLNSVLKEIQIIFCHCKVTTLSFLKGVYALLSWSCATSVLSVE